MRKYMFIMLLLFLAAACKKSEIITYNEPAGIAFYRDQYALDYTTYSFAYNIEPMDRDTVFVKMRITGEPKDYRREVRLRPAEGTTARLGTDYMLPTTYVEPGEVTTGFPVVLLKTPEMDEEEFMLYLEVEESADFVQGVTGQEVGLSYNMDSYKITMSNILVEPSYWLDVAGYFGAFGPVKFRFMMEVTGLIDFSVEAIGIAGTYSLPVKLRNALAEYEEVNGPLMEGDIPVAF